MLLQIPDVLTAEQLQRCRELAAQAQWIDGRVTAGYQGARVKNNSQLPEDSPIAREIGDCVLAALERNALFISATLPAKVYPPLINRYAPGEYFGTHVDNAVRLLPGRAEKIRTDVSGTLFLADPEAYDGGELLIEDTYGTHAVKLPAGHLVVYPSTSLHRVNSVLRGERIGVFFWLQSMVRDDAQRALLFDIDTSIQRLQQTNGDEQAITRLTGSYHNLLRMWAET